MVSKRGLAPAAVIIQSVFLGLVSVGVIVVLGCGGGGRTDASIEWVVFKQVGPRTVRLVAEVDYCLGAPVPRISRATIEYSEQRVLIKLFLAAPLDAYKLENCRGVVQAVYKTVKLKSDLAAVELFDASTNPPERRWPD